MSYTLLFQEAELTPEWILGWGDAAEVVRPRRVRERVLSVLRHALSRYGE